jgi:hypothetical protein
MPKGFKMPIDSNGSGSLATVEGDENDKKIISIALSGDDNENAFQQQITLGEDMIFDSDGPNMRTAVIQRLKEIFTKFEAEKRFRLLESTIEWVENSESEETMLKFRYLNLESDEEDTYEQQF